MSFKGVVAIGFAKQSERLPSQRLNASASRYVVSEHRRKIHYHSPTIVSNKFNTIKIWLRISKRLPTQIEARSTWKNLEIYSKKKNQTRLITLKVYYHPNTKKLDYFTLFLLDHIRYELVKKIDRYGW